MIKPVHRSACPCCGGTLVTLAGTDSALYGRPIGPFRWACSFCGYSMMGLPVPIRPRTYLAPNLAHMTCLEVIQMTQVTGR